MLAFSVAILLLVLTVFLGVGIKNTTNLTALAEGEIVLEEGGDLADLNVTKVGGEELTLWGDAEYTITSKRGAGETLIAVYATYTTGRLSGSKVMLYEDAISGNYVLYGVSGNFILTGEWVASSFEPVWRITTDGSGNPVGTISNEIEKVHYGVGVPLADMPYATGNYQFNGNSSDVAYYLNYWTVTGQYVVNGKVENYNEKYIPATAISATCVATMTDMGAVGIYHRMDTQTTNVLDVQKTKGVSFALGKYTGTFNGTQVTKYSPYNASCTDYRYWWFNYGYLTSGSINSSSKFNKNETIQNSVKGLGYFNNTNTQGSFSWYLLTIPVRFDGELRQALLSQKIEQLKVTVNAKLQVGVYKNYGTSARTTAAIDLMGSVAPSVSLTTSDGKSMASCSGYPSFSKDDYNGDLTTGVWGDDAEKESGYGIFEKDITPKTLTLDSTLAQNPQNSGFTIGFRALFYDYRNDGLPSAANYSLLNEHYALINSLSYTVESVDGKVKQTYNLNLDSNNPTSMESENVSSNAFTRDAWNAESAPWQYDGYEFVGWHTAPQLGENETAIVSPTVTAENVADSLLTSQKYYAIWQKRKYTYLEYDVFTDGTNSASQIRLDEDSVKTFEHGATTLSLTEPEIGGNSYLGFGTASAYSLPNGVTGPRANWAEWTEESSFDTTKPVVMAYEREMDAPTATLVGKSVAYGNLLDLNATDVLTTAHDGTLTFNNRWLTAEGEEVIFSGEYGILSQVLESGDYKCESTAVIAMAGINGEVTLNKAITTEAQLFTITPVQLDVSWTLDGGSSLEVVYNGVERVVAVSLSGMLNGEDVVPTLANNVQTNVGNYTAEITALDSSNYVVNEGDRTKDYAITAVELEVVWTLDEGDVFSVQYTGFEHVVAVAISGMVNGESVEATLANNAQTNVGNYTAEITALDSSNYVVNEGDRTKDYAITAVELEVVWTLDEGDVFSVQYTGFEHVVAVAISGMVNGESVEATLANNAQTNVGNYTAEITALDSSNYVVNEGDGTKDYAIEAVELQITWNFDGGDIFITQYDKQEHVANVVLSGMVNGESVEATIVNNKQTDAGVYTAEITGISSSNYYLAGEVTKDFTIEQLMVGLTWSLNGSASFERIFNGGTYSATAKTTGVIAGDGCTITLGGTNSAVEVGEYTVYAESLSNPNYVLPIENSQEWSIKPLAVNLSWNNLGYIYNGEVQSIEATINNIRGSYTCEIEYEGNEETQAGNYTATIIGLNSNNYTLTGATGSLSYDWSIAPRVISLAWDEVEFEYNKTRREVVASVTNLVSGDSVALEYQTTGASYEVSGVAGIGNVAVNAGTYTTKVVGLDNTNYTLEGTTGLVKENWSIAQKVVTIAWENVNYTYNKENRSITASVSNMVSGDDIVIEYTTTGASYEVSGVDGVGNVAVNAGAYLTEIVGISNVNYTLVSATNLSTEWGIAQKVVGLTWSFDGTNEFTTTYNGASHEVEVVLVGVEEGDIVEAIIDNASQTNAESYVAEVVSLSNANYSLPDETTKEYVINKRELTAIWFLDGVENQTSVLYNGEEHVATATLSNVVSGESVNIIGYVGEAIVGNGTITNGNTATDSSTYKTSISGLSDENNYKLAETSLSFQWGILTQELSISFENNASTYNGQAQGVTAIISGVTASDIVNITFATTTSTAPSISAEIKDGKYYVYFNAVNAGDYTAVISAIEGENSANYQLPEESDSEFSIAPRVITLAWNVEAYVYNKQNKEVTASASNVISGDEINFEYKTTGTSYEVSGVAGAGNVAVNAGEYLTEVIAEDNANYVLDESADLTKAWSISAKLVDAFTWSPASVVYNANVQSVSAQVASGATTDLDGKIYDGDTLTLSYVGSVSINEGSSQISANEATNAGEYIVRISSIGNQNYYIGTEEVTFVIGKAQITIDSTSSWSKVYDKNASYLAYNNEGVIEGTAVTLSASYDDVNAGARALQFTLAGQDSNNYYLTFNELTLDTDYVQSGKEYTISESVASIAQKSVIAEGNTSKVFDGTTEVNAFAIAESYIEEGDVINVTGAYDSALVGSVGIALQIDNPNYLLANTSLQGEITHKALSIEWTSNDALYTYNGELQGVEAVVNGMVDGYEENVYVSGAVEGVLNGSIATKKAGDYSVTLSLNSTSNYTLAGAEVSANWSIAKKALGIVWSTDSLGEMDASDNVLGWAGFLCQYAKVERFVEANLTGIVGNDDVQPVVSGNKATEAGDYNANVTGIAGVDKDNYELPEITAQEWSIVRAIITNVEMSDASYVYDKTTHGVYLSTTTTQFGDAIDVVYSGGISGSEAVDTGTYNIVATLNAGANYQPMTLTAVMEISKADVTGITLQGVNAVYDGTMKSVVLSGNTTIYGDELEVTYALTGTTAGGVSVSEVANGMINAGNYQVSATLSDNLYNNYNATTLSAEIVISAREIIVDWSFFGAIENSVYDGNEKGVTLTVSNIIAGDDVKAILNKDNASTNFELVGNFEYTHSAINALVGSSYSLTIVGFEGEDSSNYVAQGYEASAEFNIGVREVSIIGWSDGTKVYGLNEEITFVYAKSLYTLTPIFAEGNIIEGDEGLVDVTVSGNEGTDAGEYIASANIEGSGNYKTEVVTKEWSIEAKEVDLVWDTDVEKVYNGTVQTITATIVGIIKGDVANIKYSSNSGKDAGSYNVTASSLDNKNYKIAPDTKRQSMVINPASIQGVELLDKEIVFDGNSHVLEVSKTTTQFGDKTNVSFEFYDADGKKVNKNKVSDVGIYTVKAILDAGKNYEEATLEAVLTIKSAVLETPVQEGEKAEVNIESDEGFMPGTIVESKTTSYTLTQRVNTKARLGSGERVAVAYEISVVYENEESVLNGSTSVKMLIPEELRSTDFRVVNLSGDEETELEYVIEGDYVVVETTKLDTFLFIYEPEPEAIVKAYSGWLAVIAGIALVILVALLVTIFLKKTRTINFVSNDVAVEGGSVAPVKGRFGSKVNLPTPKAETMFYEGWYSDENCTQQAGPGQIPTKTSKLYAKTSNKGKRTKMPQSYVDGMSFEGWYQDEACTKKANVKKMGGKNVTLYAKWGKKKDDQPIYPWEF